MNPDARELADSFDIEKLVPEFYADRTRPTGRCGYMNR